MEKFPMDARTLDDQSVVPVHRTLPVIDLEKALALDRVDAVRQILEACQEYGSFQVINHGVCENVMNDTMSMIKEFFDMPHEDKAKLGQYSENPNKIFPQLTSTREHATEMVLFWRENVKHDCHLLDFDLWPEKPTRYREVVGKFTIQMSNFAPKMLELFCEGLGLEPGYFGDKNTGVRMFSANQFPPFHNPSLILGLPKHCDPTIMNFILQDGNCGLQVLKDGQWLDVEPIPNAFVVLIGRSLEIISNGKFKSAEHRVVINSKDHRTSVVYSIHPHGDSIIGPAKALIDDKGNPMLYYRSFKYKEFREAFGEKQFILSKDELQTKAC